MKDSEDLFESIREDLNVTPSASFDARLRTRLDAERAVPSARWSWRAAAAASVVVGAVVGVSYLPRPVTVTPQGPRLVTQALPPAVVVSPPPAEAAVPARSQKSASRSSKTAAAPTRATADSKGFDPFRDVLVDPAEQRGFLMLVIHRNDESLPVTSRPPSIDERVQVLALNVPEPLHIRLLDIRNPAGTSDGQMR